MERMGAGTSRRGSSRVLEHLTSVDITLTGMEGEGRGTEEDSEITSSPKRMSSHPVLAL